MRSQLAASPGRAFPAGQKQYVTENHRRRRTGGSAFLPGPTTRMPARAPSSPARETVHLWCASTCPQGAISTGERPRPTGRLPGSDAMVWCATAPG